MNLPSWHTHVSERQTGAWVDCTPDSTVEFARLCHDKSIPATHAEGDALRTASGRVTTGGLNVDDMATALTKRYGWQGYRKVTGFTNLWNSLQPGAAAVVQGSMAAFGPTDVLSRWDPTFDGGHAVCVMRLDATDRVWWCDPEAPAGTYRGEFIAKAKLAAFVNAFAGSHLVAMILPEPVAPTPPTPVTGDDMPALTSYTPGHVATVKATANIRNAPKIVAASVLRGLTAPETWEIVGTVAGDKDPDGGSDQWYIRWNAGRWEYTAKSNITALVDPAVPSVTQAQLDKANADKVAAQAAAASASTALAAANAKIVKARGDLA